MNLQQCLAILKLDAGASLDEIKSSFRRLAFTYHPDLNDSPNAGDRFREINEAYVTAKRLVEAGGGTNARPDAGSEEPRTGRRQGARAYARQQRKTARPERPECKRSSRAKNQKYYYREEEVIDTILNDPFAKKVFEDIYSQIRKNQPNYQGPMELNRRSLSLSWGDRTLNLNLAQGIKGWLKGQMDFEQTVHFPSSHLMPGRKVRITVEQKFSGHPKTIEVTLPPDFVVGRPIRLKGLGRKLGPFTGDLLLRILGK
ncbi:MAG: DnaJ domain-containing protein [Desulfovibrionaceae bacterium]|nr:DnaJ domain-containing protein [Desulfovibrionaceae bacterium]